MTVYYAMLLLGWLWNPSRPPNSEVALLLGSLPQMLLRVQNASLAFKLQAKANVIYFFFCFNRFSREYFR